MNRHHAGPARRIALLALACMSLSSVAAQQPRPTARASSQTSDTGPGATLDDTATLGAFLDGGFQQFIDELHVRSAVVAVIKNGRVLYARGYGYDDVAKRKPIDPATSLFRIGSTSKLFTWTAVMQLVQQGKLDLDADVNTYLKDFKIPPAFGKPITLRNLMTHSPGFEDGALGYLITNDSTRVKSIDEMLKEHRPASVRAPGVLSSYSNYGAALAGLIVQNVSGVPFNEYIRRNIFDPLDMHHSTFQEPVPADLQPDLVTGSAYENGVYKAKPFEYIGGFRPAGSASMSALDATHFMIAHLQDGRYGSARILDSATAERMHTRTFANDPRLPGMALGFYEQRMNGVRVIGHEGDTQYFHTALFIVPDAQVGIFMSYVGTGAEPMREGILHSFFDRYFPAQPVAIAAAPDSFAKTAAKYTGAYRFARHSWTKIDKALMAASPSIKVAVLPKEGRLMITGLGENPAQFAPIGNGLFKQVDGDATIGFTQDSAGAVTALSVGGLPFMGTERVPLHDSPSLWHFLLGISTLIFLAGLTTMFYRRDRIKALPADQKRIVRLALAAGLWYFLTIIVLGAVIAGNISDLGGAIPRSLEVALGMPIVFVLLTLALLWALVRVWQRSHWRVGRRIQFTTFVLAAVFVSLFFANWNLLGWRFG
ncbi:MAG TPA: serine hydrolase domain-containing protein [Gemmatimonadaceae bacterium]|nr:serine hydrolase domain-containing protein [Gemmatimonadaceae bacterium]